MKYVFRKKVNIILATVIDAIGNSLLKKRPPQNREFKQILIIRLDHLGDMIWSLGLPKILKENFSYSKVIFLTSSWNASLLENNPFIDEIIEYDAPWFSKGRYSKKEDGLSWGKLVKKLRQKKIDLGLAPRGDARENFLMWLAGIKHRVGYGITGGGFFLTQEAFYSKGAHQSQHALNLIKSLGLSTIPIEPKIYLGDKERAVFQRKLQGFGFSNEKKWIGFQWRSGALSKNWPLENIRSFLTIASERFKNYGFVIIGPEPKSDEEKNIFEKSSFINLCGKTSLRELCLLMEKLDFFVGLDSGPTHLAALMNVPTTFLYSGTNVLEEWRPLSEASVVLKHSVLCSPCHSSICLVNGHPCMSGISPDQVLMAVEQQLR